jgi:alkylation response protein AidB-like acyl-CoA dehydrogenase
MQDGAARLLQLQLGSSETKSRLSADQLRVYENAYFHLTSRDPAVAWTSGQWMTERTGGSDVSLTETIAVHKPTTSKEMASLDENIPLGPWSISGFKWFSSATDSDMTILLARTAAGGLSTFLAPMRIRKRSSDSETDVPQSPGYQLNGVRIQRLKNKVGTTSLPTAELVLDNMRGWLVGEQGKGIQQISTILTITRVHSSTAAVGYAGRSLSIARAFARVREIGAGKGGRIRLTDSPLHTRTLAKLTVEYRALMLLTFLTTYVLGLSEHTLKDGEVLSPSLASLTPRSKDVAPLLRVLGQITKAYVCKTSLAIVSACMEALGGVGYLDNEEQQYLNLSRIWRDCAVLPIWEGTTDVLSSDFVRAVKHPKAGRESLDALEHFISGAMKNQATPALSGWDPIKSWHNLRERIAEGEQLGLLRDARELVWEVCEIIMSVLLFVDARSDGDPLACDILERFVTEKFSAASSQQRLSMNEKLQKDSAIAYGAVGVGSAAKL